LDPSARGAHGIKNPGRARVSPPFPYFLRLCFTWL